jgi:precorrin-4/cobalt-precorrin-4 C11-methyltransferase
MRVFFVGAGPGDPELLTLRAERLLRSCRFCIYAGSLVNPEVLALLPADAAKHDSAALSLEETTALCLEARARGLDVVRLHSGDPSIYGAIREQMDELDAAGIDYEVIPGVSSFQAAAAALRTELTAPELAQTIILSLVADRTPVPQEQELGQLARTHATLCLFLSAHKIESIARTLAPHYGADCPAAVVYKASWPDQRIVSGTLADIAAKATAAQISKTALIFVGRALARGLPASKLYDARFSHGHRRGTPE